MRGHLSYDDIMYKLTIEDYKIYNDIIKENLKTTAETKLPFI
jgi:hypothetical protein